MPVDPTENDLWMKQLCKNCGRARELHRCSDAAEKVDQCPAGPNEGCSWAVCKFEPTGQVVGT